MNQKLDEAVNASQVALLYLNLQPDEEVEQIIRKHWGGFLSSLAIFVSFLLLPVIFIIVFISLGEYQTPYIRQVLILAMSLYATFILTFLFSTWLNYYFDLVIITNKRVINVTQEGLLARRVSELQLNRIQNVSAQQEGMLQSFFNFGRLIIETAGEGTGPGEVVNRIGFFTVDNLPSPGQKARLVLELSQRRHANVESKESSS